MCVWELKYCAIKTYIPSWLQQNEIDEIVKNKHLLKIGIVGSVIAALCCFTPILVILLSALGLSAIIGYLDIVLLPALGIFVLLTIFAFWRNKANDKS